MKKTPTEEKFSLFYDKWVCQLEEYLTFLVQDYTHHQYDHSHYQNLIAKITTHHKNYYRVKWAAAHDDVCAFFTPVWLTPLENAYLWVTGWKPSAVFRFVDTLRKTGTGLVDLTEEQVKKIESLRVKIKMEEEKVEREMERQQVGLADRRMVELVKLARCVGGRGTLSSEEGTPTTIVGGEVVALLSGLERMMKMGDCVRLKTLKGLLDMMNPKQCVELLAAQSMFHVQLRRSDR
ncbi:hypothetical protein QVD17_21962 [Tagetes erecta]|uniref:DOG1 domain-containing protein n=1 Tax=Tagetes erecta TaxID=13708 RepID=A0AAD8KHD7_TARER|nr:hypothetical protein QVD17_21962 [Tagetes erecta]